MPAPVDAHRDGVRQQYIPYRTLRRPKSRHRDDRSVAEIVISEVGIDRPETLQNSHPDVPCPEQQSAENSAWSAVPSAAMWATDAAGDLAESASHDR